MLPPGYGFGFVATGRQKDMLDSTAKSLVIIIGSHLGWVWNVQNSSVSRVVHVCASKHC